ncbi:MAG: hypothetical protein PHQ33_01975 [Bacteroidales bacterium]|jgi:hypothetical protein|nr:hypothetical protein [Bacteroidales bacterium]MDD4394638.1 hypothetical protein [Bacteroidales bacterium]
MKKYIVILCICFLQSSFISMNAQEQKAHCNKQDCQTMMKAKREYIEKNFTLAENQATPFWQAYQKMEDAEYQAYKSQREMRNEAGIPQRLSRDSIQYLTETQITTYYQAHFNTKRKVLEAEETFFKDISTILSAKQIAEYYSIEKKFKRSAIRKNDGVKCSKPK